ncbi:methyl-accepting chemotaxis protein [Carnobacterium antarcticum]|uniref:Methyl-accepting chemotaxis protein n=1 Tax=Carnobacterium antarcticum TaxID=2126436 RepID=A0ABW4NL79_9LACT|nr:methyl-accepting chemotaxis protein [Carnobacterium sp. CP1]ALV22022.1 methyl-accepting chemotaxis protein [Carnobacterium sp. CP1]
MKKKKEKQSKIKSLRTRILVGFGAVVLLIMLSSLFNILSLNDINKSMQTIMEQEMKLLINDEKLLTDMNKRTSLIRGYMAYNDEAYRIQFNTETKESIKLENKALELSDAAELKKLIDKKVAWGRLTDEALEAYDNGDPKKAQDIMNTQAQVLENELEKGFSDLAAKREDNIQKFGDDIMRKGKIIELLSYVVTILVALLSALVAYLTSRSITRPINLVMNHMQTIAGGDLSVEPLPVTTEDETGQLAAAMNMMQDILKQTMHKISEDSETLTAHSEELNQAAFEVKSGSEQVATTMQELATGTETQANTASSLSIVMGNFTKKVRDTNKSGDQISKTSQKVLEMTTEGSRLMESSNQQMQKIDSIVQDAVEKMAILDNQTKEISNLVSIIQTVADQTNLLALNAAIEAARAGEHGRGFAVVADEVRKLAEQVAVSIADITGFVTTIQAESKKVSDSLQNGYTEVEEGTSQINTTGQTFNKISQSVTSMVNEIQSISGNLESIAANSEIMNGSIEEIAAVSQESAAGVEETSAASQQISSSMEEVAGNSEHLAALAEDLSQMVNQFKL